MPDGATVIGKVAVKVVPDTEDFRKDAKRELRAVEASLDEIKVHFEVDLSEIRRQTDEALDDAQDQARRNAVDVQVLLDLGRDEVDKVKRKVNGIEANVDVDISSPSLRVSQARLSWLARSRFVELYPVVNSAATAKAVSTLAALSGMRAINQLYTDFTEFLGRIDKAVPKIGFLSNAFVNLNSLLGTASSNILVFGQSLASIAGAALALPGILGGMAIGVGSTIAVLKDFNQVLPAVATRMSKLQDAMSANFWDRAAEPFRGFIRDIFPQFAQGLRETSSSLGTFFASLAEAGTGVFDGELNSMFDDLGKSIRVSGRYSEDFLGIIQKLGSVGAGNLPKLAGWFGDISRSFNNWLDEKGSNGLQEYVDRGISALKDLGNVIKYTGSTLSGLAKAAERAGGSSLRMMAETMKSVADTVNAAKFQRNMTAAFEGAHRAMTTIANKSGPQFKSFMQRLAGTMNSLLPEAGSAAGTALGAIFDALDQRAVQVSSLDFFRSLTDSVESLAPAMPGVAQGLAGIVDVVGALTKSVAGTLGPALENLGPAVADFAHELVPVVEALGDFSAIILDVATMAIAAIPAPVLLAGAALAGMLLTVRKVSTEFTNLRKRTQELSPPFAKLRAELAVVRQGLTATGSQAVGMSDMFWRATDSIVKSGFKAALGVAGFVAATNGMTEKVGVTNTVMLGMAGAMLAPGGIGAAIGITTGYFIDMAQSTKEADGAFDQLDRTLANTNANLGKMATSIAGARDAYQDLRSAVGADDGFWSKFAKGFTPTGMRNSFDVVFGGYDSSKMGKMEDDLLNAQAAMLDMTEATNALGLGVGIIDEYTGSTAALDEVLRTAGPAMADLGISAQDLANAYANGTIDELVTDINNWMIAADSVGGRTDAAAEAIGNLDNAALGAANNANALGDALDNLLSPTLDAEAATDRWRATLRGLSDELAKAAGFKGFSEAAAANREASRQYVEDTMAMLEARAASGAKAAEIARAIDQARNAFIAEGQAAGLTVPVLKERLRVMGLTPRLVRTIFETNGLERTKEQTEALNRAMNGLPKTLRTQLLTQGFPNSQREVRQLKRLYDLTPRQVETLMKVTKVEETKKKVREVIRDVEDFGRNKAEATAKLNDLASKPLQKVRDNLGKYNEVKVAATIDVIDHATSKIQAIRAALDNMPRNVNVTITTTHQTRGRGGTTGGTTGGTSGRALVPTTPTTPTSSDFGGWTGGGGSQTITQSRVINYYAAPSSSYDDDEDLFAALDRARADW